MSKVIAVGLKARTAGFVCSCLLLLSLTGTNRLQAAEGTQPLGKAEYVEKGCYQCHGFEGQGGAGSRLAPNPIAFEAFAEVVRRPYGVMPAYSPKVLDDRQLRKIFQYLQTITDPPPLESIRELSAE